MKGTLMFLSERMPAQAQMFPKRMAPSYRKVAGRLPEAPRKGYTPFCAQGVMSAIFGSPKWLPAMAMPSVLN